MMGQQTSRTRSLIKQLAVLPVLAWAALIFGCEVATYETNEKERITEQTISIDIHDSERIKFNGKTMDITMLDEQLAALTNTSGLIVEFRVQPEAYFRTVWDVQKVLRQNSVLKINYYPDTKLLSNPE